MIHANELRIGNYILCFSSKEPSEPTQVVSVLCDSVETLNGGGTLDDIDPIPLTEEWLLKFGFVIKNHWALLPNFCLGWITNDNNYQIEINIAGVDKWVVKDIQYVHQLQNLYFALTNTELIIK